MHIACLLHGVTGNTLAKRMIVREFETRLDQLECALLPSSIMFEGRKYRLLSLPFPSLLRD